MTAPEWGINYHGTMWGEGRHAGRVLYHLFHPLRILNISLVGRRWRRRRRRRRRRDCVEERSSRLSERVRPKDKKVQENDGEERDAEEGRGVALLIDGSN